MIALLDVVAIAAFCLIAYMLYRKFLVPSPGKDSIRETAYEEGFTDAVKYFGVRKLYDDDPALKQRMLEVFSEAGAPHKYEGIIDSVKKSARQ
jgi:hypothetical protein